MGHIERFTALIPLVGTLVSPLGSLISFFKISHFIFDKHIVILNFNTTDLHLNLHLISKIKGEKDNVYLREDRSTNVAET